MSQNQNGISSCFSNQNFSQKMVYCILHQIFHNAMFVSVMAFFARISDPAVGGTYMTLLNTLTNLGGNWPSTLALWAVDAVTVKQVS